MSEWQPIESAPVSTPMNQQYFLAHCPKDEWSPGGTVHFACYYGNGSECRPVGTNGGRIFDAWMPIPDPPK